VEPVTGLAWLLWPPVGRLVRDRDSNHRTRLMALWQLFISSGQLLAKIVVHRYGGPGQDLTVAVDRRRHGPDNQRPCRVLEAVVLVRPDTVPPGGWGGVSDRAVAKAKTHLNVALTHLDEAARLARAAGLDRSADTLERLARDATEVLGKLQAAPEPTPPVDQAAGDDDQAASS
jgi:hypothetical protein